MEGYHGTSLSFYQPAKWYFVPLIKAFKNKTLLSKNNKAQVGLQVVFCNLFF